MADPVDQRRVRVPAPRLVDPRNRVALTPEAMAALGVGPGQFVSFLIDADGVGLHRAAKPKPGAPRVMRPRLLDSRYRISLTRPVLAALDITAGDYVAFVVTGTKVSLRRLHITLT